jgi:hypothetical protein
MRSWLLTVSRPFLAFCPVRGFSAAGGVANRARTTDIIDADVVEGALRRGDLTPRLWHSARGPGGAISRPAK